MKKLINGERYNQEIAMHTGYHLQIAATESAYRVSGDVTSQEQMIWSTGAE